MRKHPKCRGNRVASACVYLNDPATGHECQRNRRKGGVNSVTLGRHPPIEPERRRRWVCARAGVRACARACVCACAHARACLRDVFTIYDNDISPRLIMIILKIIILYVIQIRHTDEFPSTGTWLVQINTRAGDPIAPRFWIFFADTKLLGRTETRTRDRMYCQSIRTV